MCTTTKPLSMSKKVLADIKSVYPHFDSEQGFELSGIVWFQGWNDMVDQGVYPNRANSGGYDQYSKVLRCLIRDFRKDLSAPELPFVIGVMGVGGPNQKNMVQIKSVINRFTKTFEMPWLHRRTTMNSKTMFLRF